MTERTCPFCPSRVPVVSDWLATRIAHRVEPLAISHNTQRAVEWLTAPVRGLTTYRGITGRRYTEVEKTLIASEIVHAAESACPFVVRTGGCALGGCCTAAEWRYEMTLPPPYGFLPTLFLRALRKDYLLHLARHAQVPDAKIATVTRRDQFPVVDPHGGWGTTTKALVSANGRLLLPELQQEAKPSVPLSAS